MTVTTYLSQEGFEENRRGVYYSREINTSIVSTNVPSLWNLTINEFTYKDIKSDDLKKAIDYIHSFEGTSQVVALYNLQQGVKTKKIFAIKEDI